MPYLPVGSRVIVADRCHQAGYNGGWWRIAGLIVDTRFPSPPQKLRLPVALVPLAGNGFPFHTTGASFAFHKSKPVVL